VDGSHRSADRVLPARVANGAVALNYSSTDELWLTLYIRPLNVPGDRETSYARNTFGFLRGPV